jgi:glycosyltransferase involved in cell wall biosynthesis
MKKLSVSIGIPAYNEAANIQRLLRALLSQHETSFNLKEIIVVSDGSCDATAAEVRAVSDPRIILLERFDRQGQAARQNEILDVFSGDVIVFLNADILPMNVEYIERFIRPFIENPKLGLVSGQGQPAPARSWFEAVINFSVAMKSELIAAWNGGNNILACRGHSRAFSKAFANQFRWTGVVAEDAYSYLENKRLGYEFASVSNAVILYRSPATLADHIKQSSRFYGSRRELIEAFPELPVEQYYAVPKLLFIAKTLKYFFMNPLYFTLYILIQLRVTFRASQNQNTLVWEPSASSKTL